MSCGAEWRPPATVHAALLWSWDQSDRPTERAVSRREDKEKEVGSGGRGAMRSAGTTGRPPLIGQLNKHKCTDIYFIKMLIKNIKHKQAQPSICTLDISAKVDL